MSMPFSLFGFNPFGTGNASGYGPTQQTNEIYNSWNSTMNFLGMMPIFTAGSNFCPGSIGFNEFNAGGYGASVFTTLYNSMIPQEQKKTSGADSNSNGTVPAAGTEKDTAVSPVVEAPVTAPTAENPAQAVSNATPSAASQTAELLAQIQSNIREKMIEAKTLTGVIKDECEDINKNAGNIDEAATQINDTVTECNTLLNTLDPSETVTALKDNLANITNNTTTILANSAKIQEDADDIIGLADKIDTALTEVQTQVDKLPIPEAKAEAETKAEAKAEAEAEEKAEPETGEAESSSENAKAADSTEADKQKEENEKLSQYKVVWGDSAYKIAGKVIAEHYNITYAQATTQYAQEISRIQALLGIEKRQGKSGEKYKEYSVLSVGQTVDLTKLGEEYHEAALRYMGISPAAAPAVTPAAQVEAPAAQAEAPAAQVEAPAAQVEKHP